MNRLTGAAVVALLLCCATSGAAAAVPPAQVVAGGSYAWTEQDWMAPSTCLVYLDHAPAGSCRAAPPGTPGPAIEVLLTVPPDTPASTATVYCAGCEKMVPSSQPQVPAARAQPPGAAALGTVQVVAPAITTTEPTTTEPPTTATTPTTTGTTSATRNQVGAVPLVEQPTTTGTTTTTVTTTTTTTAPTTTVATTTTTTAAVETTSTAQPGDLVSYPDRLVPIGLAVLLFAALTGLLLARRGFGRAGAERTRPVEVGFDGRTGRLWIDIGPLPGARGSVPADVVLFDPERLDDTPVRTVRLTRRAVPRLTFRASRRRLRLNLYVRGSLVQSFVAHGDVVRDYVTSSSLDPAVLAERRPHAFSLLVNDNSADLHGCYAYFADRRQPLLATLPHDHVSGYQEDVRDIYRAIGGGWDTARALVPLAQRGRRIFTTLETEFDFALEADGVDPEEVWHALRAPVHAEVVHPASSANALPGAAIYDYPVSLDHRPDQLELCGAFQADLDRDEPPRCRHGCVTDSPLVVCPAGFWGFRFALGSPLPQPPGRPVPDLAADRPAPPSVVLGQATDPAFVEQGPHLARVRDALRHVEWSVADRGPALLAELRVRQPSLIYLYCHGGVGPQGAGYVVLRPDEEALTAPGFDRGFYRLWRSSPLVLLNGCSTAALGVGQKFTLVRRLQWAGAVGVVGTEVDVCEQQACAFADHLLPSLLASGATVGEATRDARTAVLRRGSAAGLVYTALAPADLRLVRSG